MDPHSSLERIRCCVEKFKRQGDHFGSKKTKTNYGIYKKRAWYLKSETYSFELTVYNRESVDYDGL